MTEPVGLGIQSQPRHQAVITGTSPKSTDIPALSLLTHNNSASADQSAAGMSTTTIRDPQQPNVVATTNGAVPYAWQPINNGSADDSSASSMNSVDETALLRSEIQTLNTKIKELERQLKILDREKHELSGLANSHEICKNDLLEKNQKLERENDDYLRTIVSANKKADFFEKNLREMRIRCQEQEDILRQNGLLPGPDGQPQPNPSQEMLQVLVERLATLKAEKKLESLLTAQNIKLNNMVQKVRGRKPAPVLSARSAGDFNSLPAGMSAASQGARQKTRPSTLMEKSEQAWPQLTVDKTGTKPWGESLKDDAKERTQWMPEEDRSLNAWDRQFKEQRLDKWIQDVQNYNSSDFSSTCDKDYVLVPKSEDLPNMNPNPGTQTFPRRLQMPRTALFNADTRGSVAPIYQPLGPIPRHCEVSHETRQCPVCLTEWSEIIPMKDFEAHVAHCCEEYSNRDLASPPSANMNSPPPLSSPPERTCPVCSGDYSSLSQKDFESHVEDHFADENNEEAEVLEGAGGAPLAERRRDYHA